MNNGSLHDVHYNQAVGTYKLRHFYMPFSEVPNNKKRSLSNSEACKVEKLYTHLDRRWVYSLLVSLMIYTGIGYWFLFTALFVTSISLQF